MPPFAPMLARLTRELPPAGGLVYEPKWDGFRCLAFRDGDEVDLRSRNERPLARYFPELASAMTSLAPERFVVDGEIVILGPGGFDFAALMNRLHPAASRVATLSRATPACFIAFDLIAFGDKDLRQVAFTDRRALLEERFSARADHFVVTAATDDEDVARRWLAASSGAGVDGVVAKRLDMPYEPGRRTMLKVKPDRTADCVVGGFRVFDGEPLVASLLLGLFDSSGSFRHVGVASSFTVQRRFELHDLLAPRVVPLQEHPWREGFGLERSPIGRLGGAAARWMPGMDQDWFALAPGIVCEVAYDHWDGERFRHPTRFRRFRPDRDPQSCLFDQLDHATHLDIEQFVATT